VFLFDNSTIANALKQLLSRRDRENISHGNPINGALQKGMLYSKWSPEKPQDGESSPESVSLDSDQYSQSLLCVAVPTVG